MRTLAGAVAAILAASVPHSGRAEQEDFTFKRITVTGTPGKRITVQIDPEEQARRLAATAWKDPALKSADLEPAPEAPGPQPDAPKSSYAWYLELVPTGIDDVAGRYPAAMAALSQGPRARRSLRRGCSRCRPSPRSMARTSWAPRSEPRSRPRWSWP